MASLISVASYAATAIVFLLVGYAIGTVIGRRNNAAEVSAGFSQFGNTFAEHLVAKGSASCDAKVRSEIARVGEMVRSEMEANRAMDKLAERQEPLGEPFASILHENLWNLYITDEKGEPI